MNDYLIIRLAAAGDVLLTTALTPALRQARPESRIEWLTAAYAAPLLAGNADLDAVHVLPTPSPGASARSAAALWRALTAWRWRHPRGTVLLAHRSRRLRLLVRAAGVRRLVGWGREAAFDPGQHRLSQLEALLHAAGVRGWDPAALQPRLHLTAAERAAGEAAWATEGPVAATCKRHESSGRPLPESEARHQATDGSDPAKRGEPPPRWVLAPGGAANPWARMPNRRWAPEQFGALARRARAAGIAVRWVGGDGDRGLMRRCAPDLSVADLHAATGRGMRDTGAVIAAADLVIANDSLALVLAQALARRAVGLYGPTAGAVIHAPGQPFLQGEAGCGPCYDPRHADRGQAYACGRARCMEAISAATVWQVARGSQP